jgi:hypothetical protein
MRPTPSRLERVGRIAQRASTPYLAALARAAGAAAAAAATSSPDRHQQTIDVGRRAAAAHCRTERRTGASRSSRTLQVDLVCPSLSTASRSAKRAMP